MFEGDEEAVMQPAQQELVLSWTKSMDEMPSTGIIERGHDVNERSTKFLSCASPTDLKASSKESRPTSPLECAALDSLRFLSISQMQNPLFALRGIDYQKCSRHIPSCSTLRGRSRSMRRNGQRERSTLEVKAQFFNNKDRNLPLVPARRMKISSGKRMRDTPQNGIPARKVANASASAQPKADFAEIVRKTVKTLLGPEVSDDAPLMGAGLDSIAAVELISTLSQNLNIDIEPTALFDYPTIGSLAKYFAGMATAEAVVPPSLPQVSMKPRAQVDVAEVVAKAVEELLGTIVPDDAPLMGAGLDSIAAVELVTTLSQNLSTEIEPTALFDHPTIGSLVRYFAAEMEPIAMSSALDSSNILQASPEYDAGKMVQ
jgi:acyl carrier protein